MTPAPAAAGPLLSTPIPVGVVGAGHMGRLHALAYSRHPGARLVGVTDLVAERAEALAAAAGTRAFASLADLAREVRAASVAVPTSAHAEVGHALLAAGVDLLVEKPLAAAAAAARRLVEQADRAKLLLMVGHSERFNPAVRAIADLLRSPGFVEVHRLTSFQERGTDVDVVLDLMIDDLDLLLHFVRSEVVAVDAVGVAVLSGGIDIANARIRFASGTVANLTASRVSLEPMRKLRFFEPELYVSLDTASGTARAYRLVKDVAPPRIQSIDLGQPTDETPVAAEIDAFLRAVLTREEPAVSGAAGLAALELAERVRAAIDGRS